MKEKIILVGPFLGEFYWEFARFAPYIFWKKMKQYEEIDVKLAVLTRPDRFDIYGLYSDILCPLEIEGDGDLYIQNSYRLDNYPKEKYDDIIARFRYTFEFNYEVIEMIQPDISKAMFARKDQYKYSEMIFDFKPRPENKEVIKKYIDDKPCIILAPRFRNKMKRNWSYWNELYDLIYNSEYFKKYNFIICGKYPDYYPDKNNRFLDINKFKYSEIYTTSTSGILMEILKKSILTIGSQSAIPNISLLFGVEVLEWGHQKKFHTIDYNINKTKVTFIEDFDYNISSKLIFNELSRILEEK